MNRLRRNMWGWGVVLATAFAWAAYAQIKEGQQAAVFILPNFDKDGNLESRTMGDFARALADERVEIINLRIEQFKAGVVDTRITAPHCIYDRRTETASSTGAVRIARADMVILGTNFVYNNKRQHFEIYNNARVVLRGARKQAGAMGVIP